MTTHPATSAVPAEAVVNLDGTGTWSIAGGTPETITADTAAGLPYAVLFRTVVAAAERGTEIELTATLAGVPILFGVGPTGEITRFEMATSPGAPAGAGPGPDPSSQGYRPLPGAEPRPSAPRSRGGAASGSGGTPATPAVRRRRGVVTMAVAVAAASLVCLVGLVLVRAAGGSSPSAADPPATETSTSASAVGRATSPATSEDAPAAVRRTLEVTLTARAGGPLTARVRATAAPTLATLTLWRGGNRIASQRVRLHARAAAWSTGTVTFAHTGPGRYRWTATAPGAARVSGTYTVPTKPAPRDHHVRRSSRTGAVAVPPTPTRAPAPVTQPSATLRPSAPPPAPTPQPAQPPTPHDGPVPGGSTDPPHPGPSP